MGQENFSENLTNRHKSLFNSALDDVVAGASKILGLLPTAGKEEDEDDTHPWESSGREVPDIKSAAHFQCVVHCVEMTMRLWDRTMQISKDMEAADRMLSLVKSGHGPGKDQGDSNESIAGVKVITINGDDLMQKMKQKMESENESNDDEPPAFIKALVASMIGGKEGESPFDTCDCDECKARRAKKAKKAD